MIKSILSLFFTSVLFLHTQSQELLGLGTSNYGGVAGMSLNPASIVDSRIKFDINLIGVSSYYTNNYLSVKRNALLNGSFFKSRYKDWSLVQKDLLEENTLRQHERVNARLHTNVMVPLSFMASLSEKSAIAFTVNNRTNVMLNNLDQRFARLFYSNFNDASLFNTSMQLGGIRADVLNWLDVGFTFGHVLLNTEQHFLKAAFTGKYIGGVASGYLESPNLWIIFSEKDEFKAGTAYTQYGHSNRLSTDMFRATNMRSLRPEAEGFGWNAGLVYEYRGNIEKFKYVTPENKSKTRRDANKYAFRLGVSIMDAGKLRFNKGGFNNDFTADITNWSLNNYKIKSIQDVDNMLADHVTHTTTGDGSYTVALPTAFSAQLDLHMGRGFYLNAMTYQPVKLTNADRYMSVEPAYAITPRFESKAFGLYVPVTYNEFDKWNLGATLRLGPVYIGSANLASLIFNDKVKTADIHAGIRIPIAHGSRGKVAKFYDRITQKKQEEKDSTLFVGQQIDFRDSLEKAQQRQIELLNARLQEMERQRIIDSMRLLIQPQQQLSPPVNIFINNYPAESNAGRVSLDSILATSKAVPATRSVPDTVISKRAIPDTIRRVDSVIILKKDTVTDSLHTVEPATKKERARVENAAEEEKSKQTTASLMDARIRTEKQSPELSEQRKAENDKNVPSQPTAVDNAVILQRLDSLELLQQIAAPARTQDNNEKVETDRRNMQRNMERQQQQLRQVERELARLKAEAARNSANNVQNISEKQTTLAGTVQPEKKRKQFFGFLKRKDKDVLTDSINTDSTSFKTAMATEKKKNSPFAFLKKKNKETSSDSLAAFEEIQVKEKKKFRPFAFLKKKDSGEKTVSTELVEKETIVKKKTFKPFAFLSKKNEPKENKSTTIEEEITVKKKYKPFAFLKKKNKVEDVNKPELNNEQTKSKKKWNPFGFLKKKNKPENEQ